MNLIRYDQAGEPLTEGDAYLEARREVGNLYEVIARLQGSSDPGYRQLLIDRIKSDSHGLSVDYLDIAYTRWRAGNDHQYWSTVVYYARLRWGSARQPVLKYHRYATYIENAVKIDLRNQSPTHLKINAEDQRVIERTLSFMKEGGEQW